MSILCPNLTEQEQEVFYQYYQAHQNFCYHDSQTLESLQISQEFKDNSFVEISIVLDVFWGYLYRKCYKSVNQKESLASIEYSKQSKKIIINHGKEYFSKLLSNEKYLETWGAATIKHELLHFLYGHVFEDPIEDRDLALLRNIAMDMSINSVIPNIMKTSVIPGKGGLYEFMPGLSYSDYYIMLYNKCLSNKGFAAFLGQFGPEVNNNFASFATMSKEEEERLRNEIVKYIDGGGEIPAELLMFEQKNLLAELRTPTFSKLVSELKKRGQKNLKEESSFSIPNRYFKYFPGTKQTYEPKEIYILVDTSGSINDNLLSLFYSYIKYINKFFKIIVIPFSSEALVDMQKNYPIHRFNDNYRHAKGATNFKQPIEYVKSICRHNDTVIMFTDLQDFGDKPEQKDFPKYFYFVCTHDDYSKCENQLYKKLCFCMDPQNG